MNAPSALRRLAVAACSIALAAGMTACSDSVEPTGGLAIVVGGHSNMPPPSLAGEAAAALDEALISQAYLAIVVADGDPFVMEGAGTLVARDENSEVQKRDRESNRLGVEAMLAAARAKTPETDLLTGLSLAARSIDSATGERTIVAVDSGLSTAGPLNFAAEPQLLDADPEEVAERLADAGQLPDLSRVRVVFQGLGDTVAPQPRLDQQQRDNLIAIWEAIIRAASAPSVEVEQTPLSGLPDEELPVVTPVPVKRADACVLEAIALGEDEVAFEADSASFSNEVEARSVLDPIAQRLLAENLTAALTGTTADVGDSSGQVRLSLERAGAVSSLLQSSGVPGDRLTVAGLGSDFPGYNAKDLAANRKVTIELSAPAGGVGC